MDRDVSVGPYRKNAYKPPPPLPCWYWLSSDRMTVAVAVDARKRIVDGPPIVRKFRGGPILKLAGWMRKQGGFRAFRLDRKCRVCGASDWQDCDAGLHG